MVVTGGAYRRLRVRVTAEAALPAGRPTFDDRSLTAEQRAAVEWAYLSGQEVCLTGDLLDGGEVLVHMSVGSNRVDQRTLEETPDLKLIARLGVGLDEIDVDACTRAGVTVTTTPAPIRRHMAAGALTLLLALAYRLPEKQQLERDGAWGRRLDVCGVGLRDRVVGILGLGNIGAEIARLLRPFGAQILAHGRKSTDARAASVGATPVGLDDLLGHSDYLCVACPLTDATRGLLSRERLAQMKRGAQLVNVARGAIVDHGGLAALLESGHIGGAALDVSDPEPLQRDSRLRGLPNVILTPHAIGYTTDLFDAMAADAWTSIFEFAGGAVPAAAVNRDAQRNVTIEHAGGPL